jgi:hypothetical protein
MHEIVLRNRLEHLRRRQRDEALRVQDELKNALRAPSAAVVGAEDEELVEGAEVDAEPEPYDRALSPAPLTKVTGDDKELNLLDDLEERRKLLEARRAVVQTRFVPRKRQPKAPVGETVDKNDDLYQTKVEEGLDSDEEVFEMEEEVSKQAYVWEDKYRPRKPRYFNKVHVGYDCKCFFVFFAKPSRERRNSKMSTGNKYNQTHYEYVVLRDVILSVLCDTDVSAAMTIRRRKSFKVTSSTCSM